MGTILFALLLSVPFYYTWNELAPTYFYWLPPVYQHFPFWHCVGLFFIVAAIRSMIFPSPMVITKNFWKKDKP